MSKAPKPRKQLDNTDVEANDFESVERPNHDNYIYQKILDRIHKNQKNYIAIITGETGSGKSWAAIRMAEQLDPSFNQNRIVFPPLQNLLDKMQEKKQAGEMKRGMFWVLDEGGVAAAAREWYSDANIYFSYILQSFRKLNQGLIITLPHLNLLDSQARQFRNAFIEMKRKGVIKYYRSEQKGKPRNKSGDIIYDKFYRINGNPIKTMELDIPQHIDMKEYEKRNDKFLDDLMTDKLEDASMSHQEKIDQYVDKIIENPNKYKSPNGSITTEMIRYNFEELKLREARTIKQIANKKLQ